MNADGGAVVISFSPNSARRTGEFEFAWDDILREVALADEVWHDVNFLTIGQITRLAKRWLFFPENAVDFSKEVALADFVGVLEVRHRGIGILGGSVTGDEKGGVWLRCDGHRGDNGERKARL